MSSEKQFEFTKENIDLYLKEVAKEYRKQVGKNMPAELILIGGASVLINYGFRNMTTDIDALIEAASAMKDAINRVGDRYDLPNGWLNADFNNTDSYSTKLAQFSVHYKTYSNVMTIRTVAAVNYILSDKIRKGLRKPGKQGNKRVVALFYFCRFLGKKRQNDIIPRRFLSETIPGKHVSLRRILSFF